MGRWKLQKNELLDGAVLAARYGDEGGYAFFYRWFKGEFSFVCTGRPNPSMA